ncbi:two-component regulator propeller domain-containing protein [Carboxylicivirga sp. N1Y90]|uniref:two-component regulator propeller domain-containing protein n=1 Tax=Carboxylicivirga fragile TaxID=3417571 RepID=UPI003D33D219|nr:hypothetical protein [Marinilabiliaceae bacterium N1Y90]
MRRSKTINIALYFYKILFLFLAIIMSPKTFSLNTDINFQSFNVKHGLSHGSCTAVIQDSEGYIWIATYNGLNRFDGYEFKEFRYQANDSSSLSHNGVQSLILDQNQQLWVGTNNGINLYDSKTETFERFLTNDGDILNAVYSMSLSADGSIWCGTWGQGLVVINPITKETRSIDLSEYDFLNSSSNLIRQVMCDSSGDVWICTWGNGLLQLNPNNLEIHQYCNSEKNNLLASNYTWSIIEKNEAEFYFGTAMGGLHKLNKSTGLISEVSSKLTERIRTADVNTLALDNKGDIWVGTYGDGLFIVSENNDAVKTFTYRSKDPNSISNNRITDFFFSKQSNIIWVASSDGINLIDPMLQKFRLIADDEFPADALSAECHSFLLSKNDELIISTWGNGLLYFDLNNHTFKDKSIKYPEISDSHVFDILQKNNKIYAGTRYGLNIIDKTTNRINQHIAEYSEEGRLGSNYIRDVLIDSKNRIWLGTDAGIESFDEATGKFNLYKPYPNSSPEVLENLIWTMEEDSNGNLWLASAGGGISEFNPDTKEFLNLYKHESNNKESIASNRIVSLKIDSKNRFWIGTTEGLIQKNENGTFTKKISLEDGLHNDVIFAIEEDNNGDIWFTTAKSLVRFKPNTNEFFEFFYSDGIQEKEFYMESSLKLDDDRLIFGGLGGFNIFHPDSIKYNTIAPKVVLTKLKIFNQDINEYQEDKKITFLKGALNHSTKITLGYQDNSLSFTFAALNYSHSEKNKYQYRLINFDSDWIYNGNNRTATYTNLPPGEYTFEVKAANNDGLWSDESKTLNIVIKPPFYLTPWFKITVALLLLVTIVLYMRLRTRQLKNQKKRLEKQVKLKTQNLSQAYKTLEDRQEEIKAQNEEILIQKEEIDIHRHNLEELVIQRTADLEIAKNKAEESEKLKSAFLANISHEIRTPMNAIIGFSSLLETPDLESEEQERFISHIRNNSETLLILIDDILDLSRIESGTLHIKKTDFNIYDLIEKISNQYKERIENKGLEFRLNKSMSKSAYQVYSDALRIEQITRNLLENALKFTEKGHIKIGITTHFEKNKEYLKIYIKDTGIGIPKNKTKAIFDTFRKLENNQLQRLYDGTGLGLSICKNLIKLLGGKIWVESIEYKQSIFFFTIPLKKDN